MSRHVIVPAALTALATSLFAVALTASGNPVHAAGACLAAPNAATPQGSHWYYRLDRTTQRKCWYLRAEGRKTQDAALKAEPPAPQAAEPTAPPIARNAPGRLTPPKELKPAEAQLDFAQTQPAPPWPAPNAGAPTPEAAPGAQWPGPSADATATSAAPANTSEAAGEQQIAATDAQSSGSSDDRPVQQPDVAASDSDAVGAEAAPSHMFQFVAGALALIGLLASAIFYIAARRRRNDVLNAEFGASASPAAAVARTDRATFQPLPPMELLRQHDDVEEALQRFARNVRRRAA